ncbi:MAG TPA: hypothetical protein VGO68_15765 [Pyrinomonadaceae bacterium]|nr:hypothetical protein [Pyrinomonadaceae bacterium]
MRKFQGSRSARPIWQAISAHERDGQDYEQDQRLLKKIFTVDDV